jgi:hypothetical protein
MSAGKVEIERAKAAARAPYAAKIAELIRERQGIAACALSWVQSIAEFDAACEAAEYTDTGEAWELLNKLRSALESIAAAAARAQ